MVPVVARDSPAGNELPSADGPGVAAGATTRGQALRVGSAYGAAG